MNDIAVLLNHPFGLASLFEKQGFLPLKEKIRVYLFPDSEDETDEEERKELTLLLLHEWFAVSEVESVLVPKSEDIGLILNQIEGFKTVYVETSLLGIDKLESLRNSDNVELFNSYSDEYMLRSGKLGYPILSLMALKRLGFCRKIKSYLKEKRYEHSVSVAETSYQIAINNSLNDISVACYIAGLFHDISKDLEPSLQLEYGSVYSTDILEVEEFAYHQFASCQLAREEFGIKDENILCAIASHCTGKKNMEPMSMILYSADKAEPGREFPTEEIRNLCMKDYQKGFVAVLEDQVRYFRKHGIRFCGNRFTEDMYQTYLKNFIKED